MSSQMATKLIWLHAATSGWKMLILFLTQTLLRPVVLALVTTRRNGPISRYDFTSETVPVLASDAKLLKELPALHDHN